MAEKSPFGQFIAEQRIQRSIQCKDLAEKVGVSAAYLNQIEHGVRMKPPSEFVLKIAKELNLSDEEETLLCDLYAEQTGSVPPDIAEYIAERDFVKQALRMAKRADIKEAQWQDFMERLKK